MATTTTDAVSEIQCRAHWLIDTPRASRREALDGLRGIIAAAERIRRERVQLSQQVSRIEALVAVAAARRPVGPERPALTLIAGGDDA